MKNLKKGQYVGVLGTLLVHALVLLLLLLVVVHIKQPDEDASGVPVMLGNVQQAAGESAYKLTEVEVMSRPTTPTQPPVTQPEEPLMTQEDEPAPPVVKKKPEKEKKKSIDKKAEKTPQQKAEELRKAAEEKAQQEQARKQEEARKRVAGAFGKGVKMQAGSGTSDQGNGTEGDPNGNGTEGKKQGTGGYGTFDLGGRSLSGSGLPKPSYNVVDEGRVVVDITVNPSGVVIATSINLQQTNVVNASLRRAALEAAKKARFNTVEASNNQRGTITYYFKLR